MRLDRFISSHSQLSRSEAGKYIRSGRVRVNGAICKQTSLPLLPLQDLVEVDGQILEALPSPLYGLLHKPAGYLTATRDPKQPTVMDLLPPLWARQEARPVGRLDKDTTGLLLFTSDGQLLHQLTSPRYAIPKRYLVFYDGEALGEKEQKACAQGLLLDDGPCQPAQLELLPDNEGQARAKLTITEGRFHQVKRMFLALGRCVTQLHREAVADLELGNLPMGSFRPLKESEVQNLKHWVDGKEE